MIYHIIKKDVWDCIKSDNYYRPNSLTRDGYIHCSTKSQVLKVAETFYRGENNILLLCINSKKVDDILKLEDLFNLGESYPHLYGALPLESVERIIELVIDDKGDFITPDFETYASLLVKQKEWT